MHILLSILAIILFAVLIIGVMLLGITLVVKQLPEGTDIDKYLNECMMNSNMFNNLLF